MRRLIAIRSPKVSFPQITEKHYLCNLRINLLLKLDHRQ